jgi:DNA-directed RNA polymerase subunit A'
MHLSKTRIRRQGVTMLKKKIKAIQFRIMSPEMIRKLSVMEVRTPETYDKDGYPMEGGLMDPHLGVINPGLRNKTSGQTMKNDLGHFGSLELVRPVIHPEFGKRLEHLMLATCLHCGKMMLDAKNREKMRVDLEENEDVDSTVKKILLKTKKEKKCPHCEKEQEKVMLDKPTNFFMDKERIYPTQIRDWVQKISAEDLALFGYDPDIVKPEWFILTTMPVPPVTIRPSITLETGIKSEDDLTHKLVDIIRINQRLKDNIDAGAPQLIIEDLWDLLQYHVTTYFDNNTAGVPPAKHRSGRALRTLVQRLKGKKGRFRHNLTGKRVNYAARSTVTPDPFISISEVGVPKVIAQELTVPEIVTEWNKKDIQNMVKTQTDRILYVIRPNGTRRVVDESNKDEVIEEIDVGFKVERMLQDGDIVLFNRQPSLHRLSMLAHKVRVMDGKTFRINPIVCKPYNADFDGDEMNLHVPQTEEGKTEARELMLVENQIISPRYGGPVIVFDEDGVSGTFMLTLLSSEFSKKEAIHYLYEIGITDIPKPDRGNKYSGRLIFSQLLPKDLNLEYPSTTFKQLKKMGIIKNRETDPYKTFVKIKDGKLVSGIIDDASLGEVKGQIIDALARNYPSTVIEQFYHNLSRLVSDLTTKKGMTVGLDEFEISDRIKREKEKAIQYMMDEGKKLVDLYEKKKLDLIPGRSLAESFELRMMMLAAETKGKLESELIKEKIGAIFKDRPEYNTMVMILSGARGNTTNIMNIAGFWGQASVREGRPKRGFANRLITFNRKDDVGSIAGGFIPHNFMEGMDAPEFFFHSMGGRQGEVDTGVSTKVSGYLYRRLANSLKDLFVAPDGTVRTASKNVIQYQYGEDGVFPTKAERKKIIDIEEEVKKI